MSIKDLKVGDELYCHTTGYFNNSGSCFAIAGKYYPITGVMRHTVYITNELGNRNHSWPEGETFHKYFKPCKVMVKKNNIKKLKFR
jgi:hypothetical protein